jgi:hypothetical protein
MTFECTKWRRSPRISHRLSSGFAQPFEEVQQRFLQVPGDLVRFEIGRAGQVQGVQGLAPDVELELPRGGVPDAHRA